MDLIDIKTSINDILKTNFPNIKVSANEVKEGFKKPTFFNQLFPISFNYETVNFVSVRLMIVINYHMPTQTEVDNLDMITKLNKAFGMTLKVKDRYLSLLDIRTDNPDKILQYKFDLNYFQDIEKIDTHEIMQELEMEINNREN